MTFQLNKVKRALDTEEYKELYVYCIMNKDSSKFIIPYLTYRQDKEENELGKKAIEVCIKKLKYSVRFNDYLKMFFHFMRTDQLADIWQYDLDLKREKLERKLEDLEIPSYIEIREDEDKQTYLIESKIEMYYNSYIENIDNTEDIEYIEYELELLDEDYVISIEENKLDKICKDIIHHGMSIDIPIFKLKQEESLATLQYYYYIHLEDETLEYMNELP